MWVPDPYPVYHGPRIPRQRRGGHAGRTDVHSVLPFLVRDLRENTDPAYRPTRLSALCPLCALGVRES